MSRKRTSRLKIQRERERRQAKLQPKERAREDAWKRILVTDPVATKEDDDGGVNG